MENYTLNGYLALVACIFGHSNPDEALYTYCGIPLRKSDTLMEKVLRLIKENPDRKNSEIAALARCSNDYVSRIRRRIRNGDIVLS